ncbi:MAG: hypothetical protein EA418_01120 [Wenzhouxiangellaceae bacterium]|nr:MAG: hypothetical protein EA418_01120 [Wenzhouxiangellaceae bacterium]
MWRLLLVLAMAGMSVEAWADRVFYLAATGQTEFHDSLELSDGSLLLAGQASNLDWLPAGIPVNELPLSGIQSSASGATGFIIRVSGDLGQILSAVHFPPNSVRSVFRLRTTSLPGTETGALFISGHRDNVANAGYYLARLNHNFIDGLPTAPAWIKNVDTRGDQDNGANSHKAIQPWDVGSDGRVVYVHGEAFRAGWAAIYRLNPQGQREVVEHWRIHWPVEGGEWRGYPASAAPVALEHSAIVMKSRRVGQLRSSTAAQHSNLATDENGNPGRRGSWPDDYYFQTHCELVNPGNCNTNQPGYTGYRVGANDTQRVGAVVVDRRNNHFYFGYSTQSRLPGGNPDFEPAVVAMDASGALKWWARLYRETEQNSPPDQYVDGLAIDYANDRLVVLARTHGNNVINFWDGNQIALNPGGQGFQNRFTGTNGNIHLSWLGSYGLSDGRIYAATYLGEFNEGANVGAPHPDPIMGGWPNPNAGWPNLNTTRCRARLAIFPNGAVGVACTGRRSATTVNAYQSMPLPGQGLANWNQFVRIYKPDLSGLIYSSLLTGHWDPAVEAGMGNTWIASVLPLEDGLLAVGRHEADDQGLPRGAPVPTSAVPVWGSSQPSGHSALIARLSVDGDFRNQRIFRDRFEP